MQTTSIRDLLNELGLFGDLEPADIDLLAGCGQNELYKAGAFLGHEGAAAENFFVVREGRVAVELYAPGGPLVIESLGPGEIVGWSWVFPPYRWNYDVEALEPAHVITFDGACLRDKCESDHSFGYRILKHFAAVAMRRLEATRIRLLDIYGTADAS